MLTLLYLVFYSNTDISFKMIPTQLWIGETIVTLAEERAAISMSLERSLTDTEQRLAVERVSMDVLQTKVADKKKELQLTLARQANLVAQVESIKKKLSLLSIQVGQMEQRAIGANDRASKAEEKATLIKRKMPMRLKEGIEDYEKSVSFDMDAVIVCRSTFMALFSSMEDDLHAIYNDFDLDRLK